jgi:trigger factor
MQVSVETTSELSRKLTVQVPEEKIQERVDSRLKSMAGKVRIDGFRPGKIPQNVIKKRFGPQVREEVLNELIQSSFNQALKDERLRPAGLPRITAHKADEGQGLEYEANFEVMPEFVLMPLETLEVKRFVSEVSEEDVDAMIQRLREQRATWQAVERPAASGDRLVVSLEGRVGEESFTNGRIEKFPVIIGSGQTIPGFEDHFVGKEAGAEFDFELVFPEDYQNKAFVGQTGHFSGQVLRIEENVLPALDAEFARSFGIEDGDLTAFRSDIRTNMEREMRRALQARTKTSVMDALYSRNPITLPEVLVRDEVNDLMKPYREAAQERKQSLDEAKLAEQFGPLARRRVSLALILNHIVDLYKLTAEPGRVREAVEELAKSYEESDEVVRWYYADPQRLREVENLVMEDRIVELVLEKAQTTEERIPFQELMQAAAASQAPAAV